MHDPIITTVYSVHGFTGDALVHMSVPLLREDLADYCNGMTTVSGKQDIIIKIYDLGIGMYIEASEILINK